MFQNLDWRSMHCQINSLLLEGTEETKQEENAKRGIVNVLIERRCSNIAWKQNWYFKTLFKTTDAIDA